MNLKIEKVNKENFLAVTKLKLNDNQNDYIESNSYSIAESKYYTFWNTVALYDESLLVGFAMYGEIEEEDRIWLDRYMIDKSFQGKGYGKAFLNVLIQKLKEEYRCSEIYLSLYKNNEAAVNLYKSFGFEFNGELDTNGELVMVKKL